MESRAERNGAKTRQKEEEEEEEGNIKTYMYERDMWKKQEYIRRKGIIISRRACAWRNRGILSQKGVGEGGKVYIFSKKRQQIL